MRRPDVFTLDYSHPLAQGLVFGGLFASRTQGRFTESTLTKAPAGAVNGAGVTYADAIMRPAASTIRASSQAFTAPKIGFNSSGFLGTMSAWVYQQSVAAETRNILSMARATSFQRGLCLCVAGEADASARIYFHNGAVSYVATSGAPLPTGNWVHVAGVFDNAIGRGMYVNGVMVGSVLSESLATDSNLSTTYVMGGTYASGALINLFDGLISDPLIHNRALSPAEIALLADRTDPMLGGLIVEERPVLYFDMGGSTEVEGPAVITAASTIAASGSKQATSPATVTASASVGMGGVKGAIAPLNIVGSISAEASGIKSTSSPATITTASAYGASGIKTIIGLDKEGPAVIAASSTVGMGGVKGGVGAAVLSADYAPTAGWMKGAAGQAWFAAMGEFYARRGPDEVPITADEIGRAVSLQSRNYSAVLAKRNYTARL